MPSKRIRRLSGRKPSRTYLNALEKAEETKRIVSKGGSVTSVATGVNLTGGPITTTGTIDVSITKNGATQVAAGAAAGELWYTIGHATLPDYVVMIGV